MALPFINDPVGGDAARTALDLFGVDPTFITDALDPNAFASQVPRTRTRTSHALLIRVAGGRVVGAVNGFTHDQSREVNEEFEVDANAKGYAPVDLIPQNTTQRTLRIQRYDLFQRPIEEAFGTGFEYVNLADQTRPFVLRTIWRSPVGSLLGGRRVYEYTGCYFTRFGRTARSDDNRIVNADAEIVYALRRRVN
jgi:hypothetical protein